MKRQPKVVSAIFLIVILPVKLEIKYGFPFNFTSFQKCLTNEFFNLETMTSCHYIQHITCIKVSLAITNLTDKDYNNFYQFLLLLSGDVTLNPGPVPISPAVNVHNWESLNKKKFAFS